MRVSRSQTGTAIPIAVDRYLADRRRRNYSPQTLQSYEKALALFSDAVGSVGVVRVQDVTLGHLEAFGSQLAERGLGPASVELYTRNVRGFFNWIEERQLIFSNPAATLEVPYARGRMMPVPTVKEIERLLAQPDVARPVGLRDRAILEVAYGTGARLGEIATLGVFDPDMVEGRLRVMGKGRKERVVPLGTQAAYWLKKYLVRGRPRLMKGRPAHDRLWAGQGGEKLSEVAIRARICRHARAAGIETPMSAHALRRACASHMLNNGAHPVQIQLLLGHSDLRSLSHYLRVSITDLKKTHSHSKVGR